MTDRHQVDVSDLYRGVHGAYTRSTEEVSSVISSVISIPTLGIWMMIQECDLLVEAIFPNTLSRWKLTNHRHHF